MPHRCTACGRRTYRKIRQVPVHDARCQRCVDRGFVARHVDVATRVDTFTGLRPPLPADATSPLDGAR